MPADHIVLDSDTPSVPFPIPGTVPEDGVTAKLLQLDAAVSPPTAIIEIHAGTVIPRHVHHRTAEVHWVISGELINDGVTYLPGALLSHAAGTPHGPHASTDGCRILTIQPETVDPSDFEIVTDD